jgi:hypothetical protein
MVKGQAPYGNEVSYFKLFITQMFFCACSPYDVLRCGGKLYHCCRDAVKFKKKKEFVFLCKLFNQRHNKCAVPLFEYVLYLSHNNGSISSHINTLSSAHLISNGIER